MRARFCVLAAVALATACAAPRRADLPRNEPGAALIAVERDVWTLEGWVVAEADRALRSSEAKAALGDQAAVAASGDAEGRARALVHAARSPEARQLAAGLLVDFDEGTRSLIREAADAAGLPPEDVLMDYLTFEGLFDLSMMRYGWSAWKAGRYQGSTLAMAARFFSAAAERPSAARGIRVASATPRALDIDVFGGRVRDEIVTATAATADRGGKLVWRSDYEQLRGSIRGQAVEDTLDETLVFRAGRYHVTYVQEIAEYLQWNAGTPWATCLYLLSADEVADLLAGMAAAGGLQAPRAGGAADPAKLPVAGDIGQGAEHVHAAVVEVRSRPTLAGVAARRGRYLLVTLDLESTLAKAIRAPASWFSLVTDLEQYAELGVLRPELAAGILPTGPRGARLLTLPFTEVRPGATTRVTLVYDVPARLELATLMLGDEELALKVQVGGQP